MLDKNLKGKGKASNTYIAEQNIFTYKGNALNNKNDISCANFLRIFIYFFCYNPNNEIVFVYSYWVCMMIG